MELIRIGLPLQHKETGEKRDFLPDFVAWLEELGWQPVLEHGYGERMGYSEEDYRKAASTVQFADEPETYSQDYVLVLRYPRDEALCWMRPGSCLISMCHYPTRPLRVDFLRSHGLEAISLDSLKDDSGRRIVENLAAVAWNGVEAAFHVLQTIYPPPGFASTERPPIQATILGAGAVGGHAVRAAIQYGDPELRKRLTASSVPGVLVNVVDYELTGYPVFMQGLLSRTDLLVDATLRPDPSRPVIPNRWVAYLPDHAVMLDLSVDPYDCNTTPAYVKGIEGIPQGNMDQYIFAPDDPAYDNLPDCADASHRRHVVSCYSWPGVHPVECMQVYGRQLRPMMRKLAEKGGIAAVNPRGSFFERVIARAQLSRFIPDQLSHYRQPA